MATLGIPSNTIEVLQKYHFNFQKKFGQNFLIDTHVLEKIMNAAQISKDDCVVEVGPGIGTMTQYLAERAGHVVAVEIDKALIPILSDTLSAYDNVEVINEDILKVDLNHLVQEKNGGRPIKVVANLPYYITTPIIMGLFESHVPLQSITIMVQKEVADRMQVGPGTKDYGALSLAVQYYAKPEIVANVPPNCFIPRPNVGSAVIRLDRYAEPPVQTADEPVSVFGYPCVLQPAPQNPGQRPFQCAGAERVQRKNQGSAGSDGAVRNRPRRNPDAGTVCTAGRSASRLTCCQRKGQHTDPCDTDKNLLIAFIGLAVVAGIAAIYRKVS